jgi:phosphoserine phosphatase
MAKHVFLVDLDGTLTRRELLPFIAQKFHLEDAIADLTTRCIYGEIPFEEGFLQRIEILKSIPISSIQRVIETVPLHSRLLSFMQSNVDRCSIVTGNLDVWIKPLCEKLQIPAYTSTAIYQNDFIQGVQTVLNKKQVIEKLKTSFPTQQFVAIGEGHNDAEMMELADVSIACACVHWPANSVMATASHVLFDEETLCNFLKQLS